MTLWIDLALKTAAPLLLALVTAALMRKQSAALRHAVLAAGIVGALAAPLLQPFAPAWSIPFPARAAVVAPSADEATVATATSGVAQTGVAAVAPAAAPASTPIDWAGWLLPLWMSGAAAGLAALAVGLLRLARIRADCAPVTHPEWTAAAATIAQRYGIHQRVAIRESRSLPLLVAFGWRQPSVLLPPGAVAWPAERVRIVLAHELAHIHRGDWLLQLAAQLLRAMLWFNPLAWIIVNRLRDESERACDDLVLESGVDAADYAHTLTAIARTLHPSSARWVPAPAMARSSTLERRVTAMFDTSLNRSRPRRAIRAGLFGSVVALTLVVAGFGASAQSFSTVSGRAGDRLGGHIGGVTLALVNQGTGQKYEIKSTVTGTFEFVGVVSGDYMLEASIPGFKTVRTPLTVAARTVIQNVTLPIGDLEETISIVGNGGDRADRLARVAKARVDPPAPSACVPTAAGGALKPPRKLVDVRPLYPAHLDAAKVAQVLEFNATIATDGSVREATVVDQAANPELAKAAEDAIRQWQFTPTLLNCSPVEVAMRVHVAFKQP